MIRASLPGHLTSAFCFGAPYSDCATQSHVYGRQSATSRACRVPAGLTVDVRLCRVLRRSVKRA